MTILQAAILGVVQGVSEFLPISSSGHLVLVQELFGIPADSVLFEVFVHFSTVLAVVFYFKNEILRMTRQEIMSLGVASIPAGLVGLLFATQIESLFSSLLLVAILLLITGGLNLFIDKKLATNPQKSEISFKDAFVIGLFQAVAILPGISRSGATVAGGLLQNLNRETAFRFSFLMMIPVVLGASAIQLFEVLDGSVQLIEASVLVVGGISAFITGLLSLRIFEYVMKTAKNRYFALYCFVIGFSALLFGI